MTAIVCLGEILVASLLAKRRAAIAGRATRRRNRSSRNGLKAPRLEQPRVDDLPLVPASRLKIQQCRSRVLQFQEELQGIPAGWPTGIDALRLDPAVPLPDDQTLRFFLFHSIRAGQNRRVGPAVTVECLRNRFFRSEKTVVTREIHREASSQKDRPGRRSFCRLIG